MFRLTIRAYLPSGVQYTIVQSKPQNHLVYTGKDYSYGQSRYHICHIIDSQSVQTSENIDSRLVSILLASDRYTVAEK